MGNVVYVSCNQIISHKVQFCRKVSWPIVKIGIKEISGVQSSRYSQVYSVITLEKHNRFQVSQIFMNDVVSQSTEQVQVQCLL